LTVFWQAIGEKLFYKQGRKQRLTDTVRIVFHYAEEIFALGRDLGNTLKGLPTGKALRLSIGIADALPKLVVYRLMQPVFQLPEPVQIYCYEDKVERLLSDITLQRIDLLLSDTPLTSSSNVNIYNHLLGNGVRNNLSSIENYQNWNCKKSEEGTITQI
jgi:LysR family transcriptional activator of nhaA